jgi:predicted ATPase
VGLAPPGLEHLATALARAQALAHPFSLACALAHASRLHAYQRDLVAVHAWANALIALWQEQGFAYRCAQGMSYRGWALALQGQWEAGLAQIRQGIRAQQTTGAGLGRPYWLAMLAEACGHGGDTTAALRTLTEACTIMQQSGERVWEAEVSRLQGTCLLRQGEPPAAAQAARHFHHALAVARQQQAKSLELRAAMSLSRLWHQQEKRAAAYELLAPIYGWFTEGFDTADLQEAKTLLEELEE